MLTMRTREPDPHAGSRFEHEAQEEHRCAYCDAAEVTNPGEFCSEECEALSKQEASDDFAQDVAAATEVRS
jgi:hypothetical protein